MNIALCQQTVKNKSEEPVVMGSKHPYRCKCGQVLFKAYKKPIGLQIKCPRCRALVDY